MLISKIPNLPTYTLVNSQEPEHQLTSWTLKWKQKQLLVKARKSRTYQTSLEIEDEQWLQECLKKSPVKIVQIDPAVGAANLETWATACKYAKKAIFLRAGSVQKLPCLYTVRWRLKRVCDLFAAAILLIILSPVILGLIGWQWIKSPQSPLFIRQWCVGQRGQLFQLLEFNFLSVEHDRFWRNLAQLFNVLRGEMSLVGVRPWTLTELVYLQPQQLNALPGITGIPQTKVQLPLDNVREVHLAYLNSWSLGKDLRILMQTVLGMLSKLD